MSLVRYRGRANRYANYGAAGAIARYAYNNRLGLARMARSRLNMASRYATGSYNRVTSGQGVTSQYDKKTIYRKKYMPRNKKKRWRKFKNRVLAVSTKSLGSNTIVRNNATGPPFALIPGNEQSQTIIQLALYPVRHTGADSLNDLEEIMQDSRLQATSKIIFQSAVLDITMRFRSQLATQATGNPSIGAEVDVYECTWNNASGQSGEAGTLIDAFVNAATDTATIPGQTTALIPGNRGWTPFDGNAALSQHRIKILKKTKYFLSAEQTATYQIRDPKTHIFSKDSIPSATSCNWPGVTRWILIVWKVLPGYNYVAAPNNDVGTLFVGFTRKYMYKINQDSTDYDCYGT